MKKKFQKSATGKKNAPVSLGLALQGGGSYGAFTKGALKALLESDLITDNKIEIKAVTGTSAGAFNGAALVTGLNSGGPQEAVKILDNMWNAAGQAAQDMADNIKKNLPFPAVMAINAIMAAHWPNIPQPPEPMKSILESAFTSSQRKKILKDLKDIQDQYILDWKPLQNGPVKLYVNAVREDPKTGELTHKIFTGKELTSDTITASAGLRDFGGHEVNNITFYDGAYWRNPCFSDIKKEPVTDLLAITIQEMPKGPVQPIHQDTFRKQHTKEGTELITWQTHHHLEWIAQNNKLNLHTIRLNVDPRWNETSRMNADPVWLATLERLGYNAAQEWIRDHSAKLGKKSSYETPCHKKPQTGCHCTPNAPC